MTKKLDEALTKRFCALIKQGVTQERAAWSCGVDDATVWRWKSRGQVESSGKYRDFWEAYRKALGDCEVHALSVINEAAESGEWRAMAWRLERLNPERYGQRISVRHEERQELSTDLLKRVRSRLDAETYARVEEALMAACSESEQSEALDEYPAEH